MKKIIFTIISIAMGFWFVGCTESSFNTSEGNSLEALKKPKTGYEKPNGFDSDGNLCFVENTGQEVGTPMELWMGKDGTLVGHVTFLTGPDRVKIDLTTVGSYPYIVKVAHVHFGPDVDDIPHTKNGNPIPGQFEYNVPVGPHESIIEIPVEFDEVGAIHLEVEGIYGGVEGFNFYLPNDPVNLKITRYPVSGAQTYFEFQITNGDVLDGEYEGWCIDSDHTINLDVDYKAKIYSSYGDDLPDGIIEFPDNLDLVNYLLNKFETGDNLPKDGDCGTGIEQGKLTFGDIQMAIWQLVDDGPGNFESSLKEWSQERVDALLCDVNANGEGFTPECGDDIIFIAVPELEGKEPYGIQLVIGQLPVPCEEGGGTAWGDGKYGAVFPGAKQWGTWFHLNCFEYPTTP